jgi:Barstar (barnase inhibitor)
LAGGSRRQRKSNVTLASSVYVLDMAAWGSEALLSHPLDFRLVRNGFVTMFCSSEVLQEATDWLAVHGYHVVTLDAAGWVDADDMHRQLASALDFPSYYRHNLNAFRDCLGDVATGDYGVPPDATGLVLVLLGIDEFAASDRGTTQGLLDTFACEARVAALIGSRMMCLVQSNDAGLRFEPIGAMDVGWSDAEWVDTNRGLS